MGQKIKYLGTSHARVLEKGETFNGRLPDGLPAELRWDNDNHFLVELDDKVPSEAVELLLEDEQFKDVTDAKRIPISAAENLWYGVNDKSYAAEDPRVDAAGGLHREGVDGAGASPSLTGASATGTGGSTVGGSTKGDAGAGSPKAKS